MGTVWCISFFVFVGIQAALSISPKTAVVKTNSELPVTCNVEGKTLDKCFFRVWLENESGENPVTEPMDFSRGQASKILTRKRDNNDDNFKGQYQGEGLDRGQCGVNLSELTEGRYFVGCRIHVIDGEWISDFMSLVVHSTANNDVQDKTSPFLNQTVNNMNDSRAFVFTATDNILDCQLFLPEKPVVTLSQSDRRKSDRSFEGTLEGRKCSVTLRSVTLRSNGLIWALYRVAGEPDWKAFKPQIINVNAIPGPPKLINDVTGANVAATCTVPAGSPAPRIRWELDDKIIREDEATSVDAWYWPWDSQSITQNEAFTLNDRSVDHTLTCHAYHPDFNTELKPIATEIIQRVASGVSSTTTTMAPNASPREPSAETPTTKKPDDAGDSGLSGGAICGIIIGVVLIIALPILGFFGYKHREMLQTVVGLKSASWPAKGWEKVFIFDAQKSPAETNSGREVQEVCIISTEKSPADANSAWEELRILEAHRWPADDGSEKLSFWEKVRIVIVKKSPTDFGNGNGSAASEGEELHTLIPKSAPADGGKEEVPVLLVEKLPPGAAPRDRSANRWDDVRIFIDEKTVNAGGGQGNGGEKKVRILTARKSTGPEDGRV